MDVAFYATVDSDSILDAMPGRVAYLLPASSWSRKGMRPPTLPLHAAVDTAADSGGYVATVRWGDYRYTLDEYVAWLAGWKPWPPLWAAMMDYCCEPAIAEDRQAVADRQARTTTMAYRTWREHRDAPWTWVPTVQGWTVADYADHARQLAPLIEEMHYHYAVDSAGDHAFRVGIGTLCARADVATIRAVVDEVAEILPWVPLHLWGVKIATFKHGGALPRVTSVDSAAWNGRWGEGCDRWKGSGMSQREFGYTVVLPEYLARFEAACARANTRGAQLTLTL